MAFCSQLIIDADHNEFGWEIAFRFGVDTMEEAYSDLTDEQLPGIVGEVTARLLLEERERSGKQRKKPAG